jgi:hypothetical protein
VAAAEPVGWDQGVDLRRSSEGPKRGKGERPVTRKGPLAGLHAMTASSNKEIQDKAPRKCKFAELTGCTGFHLPWLCKAFGDKTPEERNRIIVDNKLCPFCLLHSSKEVCYSKTYKTKPVCAEPGCKEQHIKWLQEVLKELPCLK